MTKVKTFKQMSSKVKAEQKLICRSRVERIRYSAKATLFRTDPQSTSSSQQFNNLNVAFTMRLAVRLARALSWQVIDVSLLIGEHFVFFFHLQIFPVMFRV
jgi:hypothetical protein